MIRGVRRREGRCEECGGCLCRSHGLKPRLQPRESDGVTLFGPFALPFQMRYLLRSTCPVGRESPFREEWMPRPLRNRGIKRSVDDVETDFLSILYFCFLKSIVCAFVLLMRMRQTFRPQTFDQVQIHFRRRLPLKHRRVKVRALSKVEGCAQTHNSQL